MKSRRTGKSTLPIEVVNVSKHGVRLLVEGKEYVLPFERHPWFKNATLDSIFDVKRLNPFHLRWPQLDVDLEIESLENPKKYPLIYRA